MDIKERYISKKEYLKRDDSNVGYALHVQNNIKKDKYRRNCKSTWNKRKSSK